MPVLMSFVIFALFSWLIFTFRSKRAMAITLMSAVVVTSLIAPQTVQAQAGILSIIQAVLNVINGIINDALTGISTARSAFNDFRQLTLFPVGLINAAKSQILGMVAHFRQPMASILNLKLNSATLPVPQGLESMLRGHQITILGNIPQGFMGTFGNLSATTDANAIDRAMADLDDAFAQDSLKLTVTTDSATDVELQQANVLEDAASQSAPGSAPFLTAAALSATVRSQALVQKMYAAELREEAAHLAHNNELRKHGATFTTNLRQALQNLLQHN